MKKLISALLLLILFVPALRAQNTMTLKLRDIDVTEFQLVKLYLNILDTIGKPITDIDSSKITIVETQTGKKVKPVVKNFFKSDEGIALCFAIDASNSMYGAPLNNVKEGMLHILSELRPQDKMAISMFNEKFYKKTGFETDREILRNNINDLETGGSSTEVYMSVIEAVKWLNSIESPKRKILILISDGEDNSSTYKIEDCLKEVKGTNITIFSIGSTVENKASIMNLRNIENISSATNDGKYYKISGPEDMKRFIPMIYDRIKEEYILSYFSYSNVNQNVAGQILVKPGEITYARDFSYNSPSKIIKNAPAVNFFETPQFIYGASGAGVILIALAIFLVINIKKKKKYLAEKEEEKRLREEEARTNDERFQAFQSEYDSLLDKLENASEITDADKQRIALLEKNLEESSKTSMSPSANIDFRRRTMIMNSKSFPDQGAAQGYPVISITSGYNAGRNVQISPMGITIGRLEGNLILDDKTVSKRHSRIIFNNGQYYIEDLNSSNGTFVNGTRISQQVLRSGDSIRIGNVSLTFKS